MDVESSKCLVQERSPKTFITSGCQHQRNSEERSRTLELYLKRGQARRAVLVGKPNWYVALNHTRSWLAVPW